MERKLRNDAFAYYFSLGQDRSYRRVAEHYRCSTRVVETRAAREGWQKKIQEHEKKARTKAEKKAVDTVAAMNDAHLKALRRIREKALHQLERQNFDGAMECARAIALSVKAERLIRGEPTERAEVSIEETIRREYQRWVVVEGEDKETG